MQTHETRSAADFSFCGFNLPLVVVWTALGLL
jgi:hypothetical protein